MRNQISKMKSLLKPKSVFVGVAVFNFIAAYAAAKGVESFMMFCWGEPWYLSPRFGYFPLLLLVATLGLYADKWWSNLLSVSFCSPIIYEFVVHSVQVANFSMLWSQLTYEPSFTFQFVFALTILIWSLISLTKTMSQRNLLAG